MSVSLGTGRDGRSALSNWWGALLTLRRERWGDPVGYLFIAPSCLLFFLFGLWPVLRGLQMAFTDYRFLIPNYQPFNGLANFREILGDTNYHEAFVRSLTFTAIYVPLNVLIPLGMAFVGPVAAVIGVDRTIWLSVAIFVAATAVIAAMPSVRAIRAPVAPLTTTVRPAPDP